MHPSRKSARNAAAVIILFLALSALDLKAEGPSSPVPTAAVTSQTATSASALSSGPVSALASQPAPADSLTLEVLESRVRQLKEAKGLDETIAKEASNLYAQAGERLKRAAECDVLVGELDKARQNAPSLLKAINEQLTQLSSDEKVDVSPEATLTQCEQKLVTAQAELSAARRKYADLEAEPKRRTERRMKAPKELAEKRQELREIRKQLDAPTDPREPSELAAAKRTLLQARDILARRQMDMLAGEMRRDGGGNDLLSAQRDLAARQLSRAQKQAGRLGEIIEHRRNAQAQEAARQAQELAGNELARAVPVVRQIAGENASLAQQRISDEGLTAKLQQASDALKNVTSALGRVRAEYKSVSERVQTGGNSRMVGQLLRKQRNNLPDLRQHQQQLATVQAEMTSVQLALIDLEEQRSRLTDLDASVREAMAKVPPGIKIPRKEIEQTLYRLLQNRREYVDALINDSNSYFAKLVDLDSRRQSLIRETRKYAAFIDERVLWIRSTSPLDASDLPKSWESMRAIVGGPVWTQAADSLRQDLGACPITAVLVAMLWLAVLLAHRPARRRLDSIGQSLSSQRDDTIYHTAQAFLLTLLLSAPLPLLAWLLSWRLGAHSGSSEALGSMAQALGVLAIVLATLGIPLQVCRVRGLAEAHFHWPTRGVAVLRRWLVGLLIAGAPLAFVVAAVEFQDDDSRKDSLGRIAFILGLLLLAVFAAKVLRPRGRLMTTALASMRGGWLDRFKYVGYVLAVGIPVIVASVAAAGYYYTAMQLGWRLLATLWLVLGLVLLNAILRRWLLLARRTLAVAGARKRAARRQDRSTHETLLEGVEASAVNLATADRQSRQVVRYLVAAGLLLGMWLIWSDVSPAMGVFGRVELWGHTVAVTGADGLAASKSVPVTLADAILAAVVAVLTLVAGKNIPGLLEITLLQALKWSPSGRYAFTTVLRYAITVVGVVVFFALLGIGWSSVQWLVAAMTVGLGFGLQEIFANFVSGLIVLVERPVRVGDVVTVGEVTGTVSRIRMRATTITDLDRKELIVPNKEFITTKLVNWTLSDTILRVVIPVGVAYGTDTELASKLLLKVAQENPAVLKDPRPEALFLKFGESSLDMELRVFVQGFAGFMTVRHELHMTIDQAFRQAGIVIPYPQRDVHLYPAGQLPVAIHQSTDKR